MDNVDKKKFIMLIYGTGEEMAKLSEDERAAHMKEWGEWMESLKQNGSFISGEPFQPTAKVIKGADMSVEDGFFVPDKKYAIGGYVMINAESMDDAVEAFKGCPALKMDGVVEVRETMSM